MTYIYYVNNELYHHGILGQRWGIRRYQNADGTLTAEGKKKYSMSSEEYKKTMNKYVKIRDTAATVGDVASVATKIAVGALAVTGTNTLIKKSNLSKTTDLYEKQQASNKEFLNAQKTALYNAKSQCRKYLESLGYVKGSKKFKRLYEELLDATRTEIHRQTDYQRYINGETERYYYNQTWKWKSALSKTYGPLKISAIATAGSGAVLAGARITEKVYNKKISDLEKYWINTDKKKTTSTVA